MQTCPLAAALILSLGWPAAVAAAAEPAVSNDSSEGETIVGKWRVGVIVTAGSGPCRGIVATTSVPADWPEQKVRIVEEEVSPRARVTYRMVGEAVKEMTARIPSLGAGQQAKAVVTLEITRSLQIAPEDTDRYVLPNPAKLKRDRKMRSYLDPSPYIESDHSQITALAGQVGVDRQKAWDRVEAIYDWVRETIRFQDDRGRPVKTTLETLRDGAGDCDELSSLFIAICRASSIPARTVRVPGHCYPEFYLEDDEGNGRWFPCQAAGTRAFGEMPDARPVLQKGDCLLVRDPHTKRMKKHRFLPSNLTVADSRGALPPQLELVLEPVSN
ncbi:MAG: transglutaminase-like domain-containing protein [Planctomycetota bacterium]|jgi:hypothetical protein